MILQVFCEIFTNCNNITIFCLCLIFGTNVVDDTILYIFFFHNLTIFQSICLYLMKQLIESKQTTSRLTSIPCSPISNFGIFTPVSCPLDLLVGFFVISNITLVILEIQSGPIIPIIFHQQISKCLI